MSDLSPSFDATWQNYQQGQLGPEEFLEQSNKQGGVAKFAEWAEAKIAERNELSPIHTSSLKKLAEHLAPVNKEASDKIQHVFTRLKEHDPHYALWEKAKMGDFEGYRIFRDDPAAPGKFIEWAHEAINTQQDIQTLQLLSQFLKLNLKEANILNYLSKLKNEFFKLVHYGKPTERVASFLGTYSQYKLALLTFPEDVRADLSRIGWGICEAHRRAGLEISPVLSELYETCLRNKEVIRLGVSLFQGAPCDLASIKKILKSLNDIPEDERKDVIKQAGPLVQGVSDSSGICRILETVHDIPADKRKDVIKHAKPLLQDASDGYGKCDILNAVHVIPPEQREEVIKHASPMLQGVSDGLYRSQILRVVYDIPAQQREDVIKHARPLFEGVGDKYRSEILWTLKGIPTEQRESVIRHSKPLFQGVSDQYVSDILKTVKDIPADQRESIIRQATTLFEGSTDGYVRVKILEKVKDIPADELDDVIKHAKPLFEGVSSHDSYEILYAVKNIPMDQRESVIRHAGALLKDVSGGLNRCRILLVVRDIPEEQREDVIRHARALFQGVSDASDRSYMLAIVKDIPTDQRESVIRQARPLFKDESNGDVIGAILDAMREIPAQQREDVIRHATPLFEAGRSHEKSKILRAVNEIPIDQRESVIRQASPLFEIAPDRHLILRIVNAIPAQQRETLIGRVRRILTGIRFDFVEQIFYVMNSIPLNQRASSMALLLTLLECSADEQGQILRALLLRSATARTQLLTNPDVRDVRSFYRAISALPSVDEDSESDSAGYKLAVVQEEIENDPKMLLDRLAKEFRQDKTYLSVDYSDQPGVDAKGLGAQFISDLFQNLIKKYRFTKDSDTEFYRPTLQESLQGFSFSAEEKELYRNLGKMMMFCLNATREYPTGIYFDEGFFSAILGFSETLLQSDLDSLNLQDPSSYLELMAIFEKLNAHTESGMKSVSTMKKYLNPLPDNPAEKKKFLDDLYAIVADEESIEQLKLTKGARLEPYFEKLQAAFPGYLAKQILRPTLAPLHEIARGMRDAPFANKLSWQDLHKRKPSEVSELLQGTLQVEKIVSMVNFDGAVPEVKQKWVKNWIANTDKETRERFLFALTGSRAIGQKGLKFTDSSNIYFHTCFNSVDFPFAVVNSEQDFKEMIEKSLEGSKYNRA